MTILQFIVAMSSAVAGPAAFIIIAFQLRNLASNVQRGKLTRDYEDAYESWERAVAKQDAAAKAEYQRQLRVIEFAMAQKTIVVEPWARRFGITLLLILIFITGVAALFKFAT